MGNFINMKIYQLNSEWISSVSFQRNKAVSCKGAL